MLIILSVERDVTWILFASGTYSRVDWPHKAILDAGIQMTVANKLAIWYSPDE